MNPSQRQFYDYHWLMLKDGRTAIGIQDDPEDPHAWASLFADGSFTCVNQDEILAVQKIIGEERNAA